MKILLVLFFSLATASVFAQPLSDRTGLSTSFDVVVDGKTFTIQSVANFDIRDMKFEEGKLIAEINSSLENNIGELQIPQNVTKGQLSFYLDGAEFSPKVLQNEKISFVTLEFKGNGTHTLEMTSEYVPAHTGEAPQEPGQADQPGLDYDDVTKIIAVVGIVAAVGVGSTLAYYYRSKKSA